MKHARPLALLKPASAGQRKQLAQLKSAAASHGQVLQFLPLERLPEDYAAIIAPDQRQPIAVVHTDPWVVSPKK